MILRHTLLVHLFVISVLAFGIYAEDKDISNPEAAKTNNDKSNAKDIENDATKDSPSEAEPVDKRTTFSGSILGSGLLNGKRNEHATENELEKRYGFLLGNRFAFGKRDLESNGDTSNDQLDVEYTKKWLGDIYGGGYRMYKRSKRDTHDKRFIRYFGNVLGRGFAFGKRNGAMPDGSDAIMQGADGTPDDLVYLLPISEDDDEQLMVENDKRYFDSVPGYRFDFGKREGIDDDDQDKRYFNSDVGGRFNFGKKSRDEDGVEKRYGFVLGRGYSFGKRGNDKRYFGHVLGTGFSFGKRDGESKSDDEAVQNDSQEDHVNTGPISKRYGWLLGRGWRSDKRGNKRFGWVLGKGRSFGKRSGETSDALPNEMYFIDDDGNIEHIDKRFAFTQGYKPAGRNPKRWGLVLGKGFSFGKRDQGEIPEDIDDVSMNMDKRYGFVLGRGYSFGKRSQTGDANDESLEDIDKRYGFVLGRGYSFGKRGVEENEGSDEDEDTMKMSKRYGFLLGRGFSFGKRGFGSVLGGGYSFGKRNDDPTLESMKL